MKATETTAAPRRTFVDRINQRYINQLLSTPQGRHHLLVQVADAEASGEAAIFEQALAKVEDADLQRMIQRHQADELEHAEVFWQRVDAQGLGRGEVPEGLKVLETLDGMLGNPLSKKITDRKGVMEAYLLLQVIEERAITQFGKFIEGLREVDPESAALFERVRRDEERHLRYCNAIAKRYAPDEQTRLDTLERLRVAEAKAFRINQIRNSTHILEHKLMPGAARRLGWRIFGYLARAIPALPFTPFYRSETEQAVHVGTLAAAA